MKVASHEKFTYLTAGQLKRLRRGWAVTIKRKAFKVVLKAQPKDTAERKLRNKIAAMRARLKRLQAAGRSS